MKKMDEMEMVISLKSIKWAWSYTVIFLFVWMVYDYLQQGVFNNPAFILLTSQNLIYIGISQFLKWKWGKDEK
ncbi:MAG: hypothetical protein WCQ54_06415 [Clostridiaceae bacterium]